MNYLKIRICIQNIFMGLFVLSMISSGLKAQVSQTELLDITEGLSNGTIQATITPPFTKNSIEKIFDGNPHTEAIVQNSDTLAITLSFDKPVKFVESKVFFWTNGIWSLEAADTEDDLNNNTGSYRLLVDSSEFPFFKWDSLKFAAIEVAFIRLIAINNQTSGIYIGEWELYNSVTLTSFRILPDPPRLVVGTTLQLEVEALDEDGKAYPYSLSDPVIWSLDNTAVATISELGALTGVSIGTSVITAKTSAITGTTTVGIEADFESTNADPLYIKVALVIQNPVIDSVNMRKVHEVRGWTNPYSLVNQILEEFSLMSDGVVRFEIVETYDDQNIFTRLYGENDPVGELMSIDTMAYYYSSLSRLYGRDTEGTLQNLAEIQGRVRYDYNAMIDFYNFHIKRNNNEIHEIWVYAPPFGGMYESQLLGPNAFWYNSPPKEHPGLEKLLSVMGWNYERGVAEAIHSFGHRVESSMVHAYGDRWDVFSENPTNWEIFTRVEKDLPGQAHIGNIHFPPNGTSDYDYSNLNYVKTYADNWKRYPILLDQTRTINSREWGSTQLGYMRWWHNHLPRYTGVTDGVLNNWWHYVVDYEGAVEEALRMTSLEDKSKYSSPVPGSYFLDQNYPNPFNPVTKIRFSIKTSQRVTVKIYDILGREVKVLIDDWKIAGQHELLFNGSDLASGVYFYKFEAGNFNQTKKLILLK